MDELREKHDALLANKPDIETAVHDEANCPYCNPTLNANDDPTEGGNMKTYNEEELNAAVTAAVEAALAPVQAELNTLKTAQGEAEVDARVAEAQAEAAAALEAVQSELDTTKVELAAATTEFEDFKTELAAIETAAQEEALKTERKTTRLAEISSVVKLDEDYVEANIDRWAEKSDEDFADLIAGWKAVASKSDAEKDEQITEIPETAMSHVRDGSSSAKSAFSEVLGARQLIRNI